MGRRTAFGVHGRLPSQRRAGIEHVQYSSASSARIVFATHSKKEAHNYARIQDWHTPKVALVCIEKPIAAGFIKLSAVYGDERLSVSSEVCPIYGALAMSQYDRLCKPPEPMANISRGSDAISQGGRRRKSWPQPVNIAFTTASGDCRLRPAAAERSSFGNVIFGRAVRLYVSKQKTRAKSITASLGRWQ